MELLIYVIALLAIVIILLQIYFRPTQKNEIDVITKLDVFSNSITRIENSLKDDIRINRDENAANAKINREELNKAIADFRIEIMTAFKTMTEQNNSALEKLNLTLEHKVTDLIDKNDKSFKLFTVGNTAQLEKIEKKVEDNLKNLTEQAKLDNTLMRDVLINAFKGFEDTFDKNVKSFNDLQKEKFELMETKQNELVKGTETKLESIRATVEEKLEKTLSERLGQSFETVGKQLIEVQKGLREMQTLATDVGGLKKVLSNVKLRGGVGEVQLALLLEQILAPNQYDANVRTKKGSNEPVEFAIKLPGRSEDESAFVYLPIDAKFPKDTYEH